MNSPKEKKIDEPAHAAPPHAPSLVPMHVGDAPFRNLLTIPENAPQYLVEAKREIQTSAVRRLEALEKVHRELVKQAQEIVVAARRDMRLHDFRLCATKIRGKEYHLYHRPDRQPEFFFSLLEPDEYASADACARYLASYRLNEDNSWTRLDDEETDEKLWLSEE